MVGTTCKHHVDIALLIGAKKKRILCDVKRPREKIKKKMKQECADGRET